MGDQRRVHPLDAGNANVNPSELALNQEILSPTSSALSKDSLIQSLQSNGSGNSYLESGDFFPDSKSLQMKNIFRSTGKTGNTEDRDDTSIIGDDMSLSVATSADFSFATANTENYHYPAQYNPQQQQQHLQENPQAVKAKNSQVKNDQRQRSLKDNVNKVSNKLRSNNKSTKTKYDAKNDVTTEEIFCGMASSVGNAVSNIASSLNCCFSPVNENEEGKTKSKASEMRDFFSPCIRPNLDSTSDSAGESVAGSTGSSVCANNNDKSVGSVGITKGNNDVTIGAESS